MRVCESEGRERDARGEAERASADLERSQSESQSLRIDLDCIMISFRESSDFCNLLKSQLHDTTRSFHVCWAENVVQRTIAHSLHNFQLLNLQVPLIHSCSFFFPLYFRVSIFHSLSFRPAFNCHAQLLKTYFCSFKGCVRRNRSKETDVPHWKNSFSRCSRICGACHKSCTDAPQALVECLMLRMRTLF